MKTFLPTETCPHTCAMLRHVFGTHELLIPLEGDAIHTEAATLGLDYVKLLMDSTERLPVLILWSGARAVGKTTFLNWLELLMAPWCTCIGAEDLVTGFNAHFVRHRLVTIDPAPLEVAVRVQLQHYSTAKEVVLTRKGEQDTTVAPKCQFVVSTNHVPRIDQMGWLLELHQPTRSDRDLSTKLEDEVGAFLDFLVKYTVQSPQASPTWFAPELLRTQMAGQ